jgi:hypothetical protein
MGRGSQRASYGLFAKEPPMAVSSLGDQLVAAEARRQLVEKSAEDEGA